jgi:chromosome segregation ATPase
MIDQKIADAVTKLATKEDISAVSDTLNAFENHLGFVSTGLDDKTVAETLDETFAKKAELTDALNELKVQAEAKNAEIISYVDSELDRVEGIISNINHFKTEIVADITKVTDIGVLYLIKDDNAVGIDKYNEYIVVDGKPILIGDTTTDLSNYYNKAEIAEVVSKIKVAIKELKAQFEVAADTQNVLADRVTTLENNTVTNETFEAYKETVDYAVAGARDAAIAWTAEQLIGVREDIEKVHDQVDAVHREIDELKEHIENTYVTINELEAKQYITEAEAETLVDTRVQEVVKKELEAVDSIAYGDFDI